VLPQRLLVFRKSHNIYNLYSGPVAFIFYKYEINDIIILATFLFAMTECLTLQLKGVRIYFSSQFLRVLSVAAWPKDLGKVHDCKGMVEDIHYSGEVTEKREHRKYKKNYVDPSDMPLDGVSSDRPHLVLHLPLTNNAIIL
jgi:hypothetical protein